MGFPGTAYDGDPQVVDKSSKTSQGNRGKHVFEQNLEVHLHREPDLALEFEITRWNHMKVMEGRPYTETAMFKDPPNGIKRRRGACSCTPSRAGSSFHSMPATTARPA